MASRQRTTGRGSPSANGKPTKAERKEEARRQRIELERRMARAKRNRTIGIAVLVVAVAAVVGVLALTGSSSKGKGSTTTTGSLAGVLTGPAPWGANTDQLGQRLGALNLPAEGNALHVHSFLSIFVDGAQVQVPPNIGLTAGLGSPLHTHTGQTENGIIHVESADPNATFDLGEFFDVWGVRLTPTCIGSYCGTGDKQLRVFVDGHAYAGDPRAITLQDRQAIVLSYGTKEQVPDPVPTVSSSSFFG